MAEVIKPEILDIENSSNSDFSNCYLDFKITLKNKTANKEIVTISKTIQNGLLSGIKAALYGLDGNNNLLSDYYVSKLEKAAYELSYKLKIDLVSIYGPARNVSYNSNIIFNIYITSPDEYFKKWNALTVCERALAIAEPLRKEEEPRFKLDTKQKDWLESIETPEFQFTQSNLREVLQGIGSYLHAEPRLIKRNNEYVVTFDKYGGNTYSEFVKTYNNYASQQKSIAIENFATNLDSSVDNLVNSIDNSFLGSAIEPFINGYKTVLAEGSYVRITDENMFIQTNYPIREIKKLTASYKGKTGEITPFVFESGEYKQLSSFDNVFPKSKSYAIYYTIGQKGIQGLNFKVEKAAFGDLYGYSIINILIASGFDINILDNHDYQNLAFQIEYIPIYSARVQQNKSLISSGKKWTKPYNQSQNMIESKYYGENLKGVIARLGNVDRTITYVIPGYPKKVNEYGREVVCLPKIGELFDDNYYISNVATEIYPFYTKITLTLSKDFNKYSEHIGVNSVKRMYEISEQQAFDSEISYREFVVFFGDLLTNKPVSNGNLMLQDSANVIQNIFQNDADPKRVGGAKIEGLDESEVTQSKIILPVIASSFGNACLLTFKMEDNYSAGTYSYSKEIKENGQTIQASYTQTLPYADVYGNLEYLKIDFINDIEQKGNNWNLPPNNENDWVKGASVVSTGKYPLLIKKGNSEIISFNYQLEFITTLQDLIIGSGISSNIEWLKQKKTTIKVVLHKDRLNKFNLTNETQDGGLEQSKVITFTAGSSDILNAKFTYYKFDIYTAVIKSGETYNSWGIYSVDGDKKTLLLGKNMPIENGTNIFENLNFAVISERDLENLEEKEIKK